MVAARDYFDVSRCRLDVVAPKAFALRAVLLCGCHGWDLCGVSQQGLQILCYLEFVAVGCLLTGDAVRRPRYSGEPPGIDFGVAMQACAINSASQPGWSRRFALFAADSIHDADCE